MHPNAILHESRQRVTSSKVAVLRMLPEMLMSASETRGTTESSWATTS
jgi:hypothetical protein